MSKIIATYRAPEGDAELCTMGGMRFVDGEPVEFDSNEFPALADNVAGNPCFDVEGAAPKPRRGRPPKVREAEPDPVETPSDI